MFPSFLNIPLKLGDIKQKADVSRVSVSDSIHNMIHLITTSSYGEFRADSSFGCDIWSHDFENVYNPYTFREELKKSIQNSIKNNELRLININVDLTVEQVEITNKINNRRIKTRILLTVKATIAKTNEPFLHKEMFFIGPLSYS